MNMPRIVILDGYTLNPGDLDWSGLAALGELVVYDRTAVELVVERSRGAGIVLTNKTPLSAEALERLPDLRAIGVLATGYNVVDTAAARARGIPVMNVPGYGTAAVAQHVFALLLELTQRSGHHSAEVHGGAWSRHADWCFWNFPLVELSGLTMGIVGLGSIGRQAAGIARAFGMTTVALARGEREAEDGVAFLERGEFLAVADVISLHCPLVPGNAGMVNADWLRAMKRSAYLINTARGPLIDEAALAAALRAGEGWAGCAFRGATARGSSLAGRAQLRDHAAPRVGRAGFAGEIAGDRRRERAGFSGRAAAACGQSHLISRDRKTPGNGPPPVGYPRLCNGA
jgi:glycerate dehydrogenase